MERHRPVLVILLMGMAAAISVTSAAAGPATPFSRGPGGDRTAAQFAAWIASQRQAGERRKQPPAALEQALILRLESDRQVLDRTVLEVVDSWTYYESTRPVGKSATGARFPQTQRLIRTLVPYLEDRVSLKSQLFQKSAALYRQERDFTSAAREYQRSLDILTPLQYEMDRQRMESLVEGGAALEKGGDHRSAERLYLKALQYPFYEVSDPVLQQVLRDFYVRAGHGLIDVRRRNLPALKEIILVPSTEQDLGPYLQAAIKEAGG